MQRNANRGGHVSGIEQPSPPRGWRGLLPHFRQRFGRSGQPTVLRTHALGRLWRMTLPSRLSASPKVVSRSTTPGGPATHHSRRRRSRRGGPPRQLVDIVWGSRTSRGRAFRRLPVGGDFGAEQSRRLRRLPRRWSASVPALAIVAEVPTHCMSGDCMRRALGGRALRRPLPGVRDRCGVRREPGTPVLWPPDQFPDALPGTG